MQYLLLEAALVATVSAQAPPCFPSYLCYNVTAANAYASPDCTNKFTCLTTEKWLDMIREPTGGCFKNGTRTANAGDGCGYDDFACHCTNYQVYSEIIDPLVFPRRDWRPGYLFLEQLGAGGPMVNDFCNYFNATRHAAYATCPRRRFSVEQTLKRAASSLLYIYDAEALVTSQPPPPAAEEG